MKVNVVYAHPAADSYNASLHQRILRTLRARGDEVIDFDLYAMKFDPAMGEEEWLGHEEPLPPPQDLEVYIDALKWADACVFCFPTWWLGMPAFSRVISIAYGVRALPLNSRRVEVSSSRLSRTSLGWAWSPPVARPGSTTGC